MYILLIYSSSVFMFLQGFFEDILKGKGAGLVEGLLTTSELFYQLFLLWKETLSSVSCGNCGHVGYA